MANHYAKYTTALTEGECNIFVTNIHTQRAHNSADYKQNHTNVSGIATLDVDHEYKVSL